MSSTLLSHTMLIKYRKRKSYKKKKKTNNPSDAIKENIGEKHWSRVDIYFFLIPFIIPPFCFSGLWCWYCCCHGIKIIWKILRPTLALHNREVEQREKVKGRKNKIVFLPMRAYVESLQKMYSSFHFYSFYFQFLYSTFTFPVYFIYSTIRVRDAGLLRSVLRGR